MSQEPDRSSRGEPTRGFGAFVGYWLSDLFTRGVRLPPGRLGVGSLARLGDERFYFRKHRRHGPIFKVLWNRNLTTCIVGFERARRLFAAHAAALLPMTIDIASFVPYGFMRSMASEPHARYRSIFAAALRDDLVEIWSADIRSLIRSALERWAETPQPAGPDSGAPLTDAVDRVSIGALLMMWFGVRPGHPTFAAAEAAHRRMGPTHFVHPIGPEQLAGFDTLHGLVWDGARALARDRHALDDGVLARIVAANTGGMDETVVGNFVFMIEMGRYDVRSLMRWVLKYLSDAPEVVDELRRLKGSGSEAEYRKLARAVVLETLRLDQAEGLNRLVLDDIVFDGYRVPRGTCLRVLLRETHGDPEAFPEPERFKPCRFADRVPSSRVYAPFGVGDHRCIAAQMVVGLAALLVEELVAGFTWTVSGDGSRHRGTYHWEPAPTFNLSLQPLSVSRREFTAHTISSSVVERPRALSQS